MTNNNYIDLHTHSTIRSVNICHPTQLNGYADQYSYCWSCYFNAAFPGRGQAHDFQGDREGRPYNIRTSPTAPWYCAGDPRGRPGKGASSSSLQFIRQVIRFVV